MTSQRRLQSPSSRRRFRRTPVLLSGRLFRGGRGVDCIITNISAGGARISAVATGEIGPAPETAQPTALLIERYGVFQSKVMWADGKIAGVRFLHSAKAVRAAIASTTLQQAAA